LGSDGGFFDGVPLAVEDGAGGGHDCLDGISWWEFGVEASEAVGCVDGGLAMPCSGFAERGEGLAPGELGEGCDGEGGEEGSCDVLIWALHGVFYRSIRCLDTISEWGEL